MGLVLLILLGFNYPYNWVTDQPYNTMAIMPEVMKDTILLLPEPLCLDRLCIFPW